MDTDQSILSDEDVALLDHAPGNAVSDSLSEDLEDVIEDTPPSTPKTTTDPVETEQTVDSEELLAQEDETPLTEREKILLAELEKVTDVKSIAKEETSASSEVSTPTRHDFLADVDIDEVLTTTDGLNSLLNSVYNKAMSDASRLTAEQIMKSLPQVVTTYVQQHIAYRETVNDFYQNNPDLMGVKKTLARVANEVTAEKPELDLEGVFDEAATRTRKLLGLRKSVQENSSNKETITTSDKKLKPAFARSKGRPTPGNLDSLATEIDALLNV
jgi:hypothetical protein